MSTISGSFNHGVNGHLMFLRVAHACVFMCVFMMYVWVCQHVYPIYKGYALLFQCLCQGSSEMCACVYVCVCPFNARHSAL